MKELRFRSFYNANVDHCFSMNEIEDVIKGSEREYAAELFLPNKENMERNKLRILRIHSLIKTLLLILSVFLLQMFAIIVWSLFCRLLHYLPDKSTLMMQVSILSSLFCILWFGRLYQRSSWRESHFNYRVVFSAKNIVAIIAIGMGGCIVVDFLMSVLQTVFPAGFEQYAQTMEQFGQGNLFVTYLYVLLLGPVAEELIFRGAIMDRLHLAFPFWLANILQAALFALYHMNLIQGLYAFCMGLVFGLLREAMGSIFCNMCAHILFNSTNYLLQWISANEKFYVSFFLEIFFVGIIFFVWALWYTWLVYLKKQQNIKASAMEDGKEREK